MNNDEFQNKIPLWTSNYENIQWYINGEDKSLNSVVIEAKLRLKCDEKSTQVSCKCITENTENAIRSAVTAIEEGVIDRIMPELLL